MTEGTYDTEYVKTHADGFDWFEYYVLGNEDGVPKTPEWAEEKCGVPAYRIKALARYWAKHNVSIGHCNGGGYIRSCYLARARAPGGVPARDAGQWATRGRNQVQIHRVGTYRHGAAQPAAARDAILPEVRACYHGSVAGRASRVVHSEDVGARQRITASKEARSVDLVRPHREPPASRADQFKSLPVPRRTAHHGIQMIWSDSPCWSTCWNGGNAVPGRACATPTWSSSWCEHPWMENDTLFADMILPISTTLELDDIRRRHLFGPVQHPSSGRSMRRPPVGESLVRLRGRRARLPRSWSKLRRHLRGPRASHLTVRHRPSRTWQRNRLPRFGEHPSKTSADLELHQGAEATPDAPHRARAGTNEPAGMRRVLRGPATTTRMETPTGKIEFYSTGLAELLPRRPRAPARGRSGSRSPSRTTSASAASARRTTRSCWCPTTRVGASTPTSTTARGLARSRPARLSARTATPTSPCGSTLWTLRSSASRDGDIVAGLQRARHRARRRVRLRAHHPGARLYQDHGARDRPAS